jgi:hypothetical protein
MTLTRLMSMPMMMTMIIMIMMTKMMLVCQDYSHSQPA